MDALIRLANSPQVQRLIDGYYDIPAVQGFALGVHGNFITLFRNEFGTTYSVNQILQDSRIPAGWAAQCTAANYAPTLSAIYIVIYVTMDEADFRTNYSVPVTIPPGHAVIVERISPIAAQHDRQRHRPIRGGISISSFPSKITGTLGGFLQEIKTGDTYLLSCKHIFSNSGSQDVIIQQGNDDGGTSPSDDIAALSRTLPFITSGGWHFGAPFNKVDAAVAKIDSSINPDRSIRLLGSVAGTSPISQIGLYDPVVFVGKESDRQEAQVSRYIARGKVRIFGKEYNFGDFFEIEPRIKMYFGTLSKGGDSGAWVIKENLGSSNLLYGILFAGTGTKSFCCFIQNILSGLNNEFQLY